MRGRRWDGGLGSRDSLQDQRLGENGLEEMLSGRKMAGSFGGVGESGDAEDEGVGGFFGAEPDGRRDSGLTESASEAEYSSESAHEKLLVFGKFGEAVFEFGFGAALKTNGPREDVPLIGGPIRRNRKIFQEFANGFGRKAMAVPGADPVKKSNGVEDTSSCGVGEDRSGIEPAKGIEDANSEPRFL
jgi:hypothetical protein